MIKEKKDFQRTIHMTQTTKNILLQQEGAGMNEQFESLVHHAHIREKEIDKSIKQKEMRLAQLNKDIESKYELLQKISTIEHHVNQILNTN